MSGCNTIQIGQTSTAPVIFGNTINPGSSGTQLMAVPMTLFVPLISNSSTPCSGVVTNANTALVTPMPTIQTDATRSCASDYSSQVLNLSQSNAPVAALQKRAQVTTSESLTKSVRAIALAAGARIASPTAAASIIKAMQSKTPIHIKAGESSPTQSTSLSNGREAVVHPPSDSEKDDRRRQDEGSEATKGEGC